MSILENSVKKQITKVEECNENISKQENENKNYFDQLENKLVQTVNEVNNETITLEK